MPDGQGFALGAEQHFLMRDQPAEPDTMHSDAVNLCSAGPGQLLHGRIRRRSEVGRGASGGNLARCKCCGSGWCVRLAGMMQLNDLRALVERCCLLGEAHHQYRSDGEVGCDEDPDTVMVGKSAA